MVETLPRQDAPEVIDAEVVSYGRDPVIINQPDIIDAEIVLDVPEQSSVSTVAPASTHEQTDAETEEQPDRTEYEALIRSGEYGAVSRKGWTEDGKQVSDRRFERRVRKLMKEFDRDFPQPKAERDGSHITTRVRKAVGEVAVRATEAFLVHARDVGIETAKGTASEIRTAKRLGGLAARSVVRGSSDLYAVAATNLVGRKDRRKKQREDAYENFWRTASQVAQQRQRAAQVVTPVKRRSKKRS